MQTGNVILVHNPFQLFRPITWLAWLIRAVTKTYYNHCALVLVDNEEVYIVEALGKGVVKTPIKYWQTRAKREITILPIMAQPDRITVHVGKRYDWPSLFYLGLIRVPLKKCSTLTWLGLVPRNPEKKLYCYELAALVHQCPNWHSILPEEFIETARYKIPA